MATSNPDQVDQIYLAALALSNPAERSEYLERVLDGKPDLRQRVERLLSVQPGLGSFLETPAPELDLTVSLPATEQSGAQIGHYKLLQLIGEGGMGTVWMAEQNVPVRRRVALKLIKRGMDSRQVLARFEAERQALSLMDHPNIARVLDAGTTEGGRPYFAMELVKGTPITNYCDENQLAPRERLELFLPVCHAIQHAHQKGIIHRDIKPSNVLVAEYDGRPMAKVIDFGVAKAVSQPLTEMTMFTGLGQVIGTLEYMSPEQARVNQLDIDTRSDIYSLGVLLYELLTGSTPFDKQRLRSAAFDEVLRIIREEEPPPPSTKLGSGATSPAVATSRKMEAAKLCALIRGELDWIVMKSLEKDRARRYETANGLANDIQRYLNDESVAACPPSAAYRLRKLMRRYKAAVITTGLVAATVVVGLFGTTWQAFRATIAERQALASVASERQAKVEEAAHRKLAEVATQAEKEQRERAEAAAESARLAKNAESELRMLAMRATEDEKRQREEAERLRELALQSETRAVRNLYSADMNLAQQALERGHLPRVRQLLERHVPMPGGQDWRQFEWYYLLGQLHQDQWTIRSLSSSKAAFSPDSRRIAVGQGAGIEIWELESRRLLRTLQGTPSTTITSLAFSPDGRRLLSGSSDFRDARPGECVVWDADSGMIVMKLAGICHSVRSALFSPDGSRILAADAGHYDNKTVPTIIRVWNSETGESIKELNGHTRTVHSLAFSPDGKKLASAEMEMSDRVFLWDMESGSATPALTIRGAGISWSPDGTRIATICPTAIWDPVTGERIHDLSPRDDRPEEALGLCFSPDGRQLAVAMQRENNVQVWDVATGQRRAVLKGHTNWVFNVAYSPDGRWLASTGRDGVVKLWNLAATSEWIIPESDAPWTEARARERSHLSLSRDGTLLAAVQNRQHVTLIETESLRTKSVLDAGETIHALSLSSDGRRLLIGTTSSLQAWDLASNQRLAHTHATVRSLCLSVDERSVFAAVGDRIVVYAADDLRPTRTIEMPGGARVVLVGASPDSKHLAILSSHNLGDVYLWDLADNAIRARFNVSRWTGTIAFSSDGKLLAAGGGDWFMPRSAGLTKLWNVDTLEPIATFEGHDGLHTAVAFTPDGRSLATASDFGEITLWDLETLEERITLHPGSRACDCLQFSSVGGFLVSGSHNEGVRLWRTASREKVRLCELSLRVGHHDRKSEWEQSVIASTEYLNLDSMPFIRERRGVAHAELEQWPQAVLDFRLLAETYLSSKLWWRLALAQLAMGDRVAYGETVTEMLKKHITHEKSDVLELCAWTATLQDSGQENWVVALKSAVEVPPDRSRGSLADVAIGAALLRGGCLQDAVDWLEGIAPLDPLEQTADPAYRCFLLATAFARLGNRQQAMHWYQDGTRLREATLSSSQRTAWTRRLTLKLLAEEAELAVDGIGITVSQPRRLDEFAADYPELVQQIHSRRSSPPKP